MSPRLGHCQNQMKYHYVHLKERFSGKFLDQSKKMDYGEGEITMNCTDCMICMMNIYCQIAYIKIKNNWVNYAIAYPVTYAYLALILDPIG